MKVTRGRLLSWSELIKEEIRFCNFKQDTLPINSNAIVARCDKFALNGGESCRECL